MKRFMLPAVAVVVLGLAPAAAAQVVVPEGGVATVGSPDDGTGRTPRIAGTGRTSGTERTGRTYGTARTPGTGRTYGTPRTPGTDRTYGTPRSLPATGSTATALAIDGAALLGAGLVFVRTRRRVLA